MDDLIKHESASESRPCPAGMLIDAQFTDASLVYKAGALVARHDELAPNHQRLIFFRNGPTFSPVGIEWRTDATDADLSKLLRALADRLDG